MTIKIALIEDNADNRFLIQSILEDLYEIIEYETGIEALKHLNEAPPALILLDISLPGMDGIEVLQKIRAQPELNHIPVVALTAHVMLGDREALLSKGFNEYIAKPIVDIDKFINAIKNLIPKED